MVQGRKTRILIVELICLLMLECPWILSNLNHSTGFLLCKKHLNGGEHSTGADSGDISASLGGVTAGGGKL